MLRKSLQRYIFLSKEASSIRWSCFKAMLHCSYGRTTLAGITGDADSAMPMVGVPWVTQTVIYLLDVTLMLDKPVSLVALTVLEVSMSFQFIDASFSDSTSTTYEIKYASDLGGDFDFLIGAIISNSVDSFYDVYASGITMNGLQLPATIAHLIVMATFLL